MKAVLLWCHLKRIKRTPQVFLSMSYKTNQRAVHVCKVICRSSNGTWYSPFPIYFECFQSKWPTFPRLYNRWVTWDASTCFNLRSRFEDATIPNKTRLQANSNPEVYPSINKIIILNNVNSTIIPKPIAHSYQTSRRYRTLLLNVKRTFVRNTSLIHAVTENKMMNQVISANRWSSFQ